MPHENGITVVGVEVSNFHRLRVARVEMVPGEGLVRVTGKNGSGKTSLLRSLKAALGGQGEVLADAVVNEDSEDGTGEVRLTLSNGFTVARRFTEANPKGYLTVVGPDGGKHAQGKLAEWLGPLSFDPLGFIDMPPKRQNEILLSLGSDPELPTRLEELRAERARKYSERTPWISKKRDASKVRPPEGARPEPISTMQEMTRLGQLQKMEREKQDAYRSLQSLCRDRERNEEAASAATARIEEIQQLLQVAEAKLADIQSAGLKLDAGVDVAHKAYEDLPDPTEEMQAVQARISEADAVQAALRPWEDFDRARATLEEATAAVDAYDAEMEAFDVKERELVASAGIPIEGLTFTEQGPLLNGRPLSVASGAERIRLAVAVALTSNPDLRICLVDEANDIDLEGLEALDALAKEHGFQIWAARLGIEGEGEIVVVDGAAFNRGFSEADLQGADETQAGVMARPAKAPSAA